MSNNYTTRVLTTPQRHALRLLGKTDVAPRDLNKHGFHQSVAFNRLVNFGYAKLTMRDGEMRWSLTPHGMARLAILNTRSAAIAETLNARVMDEVKQAQAEIEQPASVLALPAPESERATNYVDAANLADAIIMSLDDMQRHCDALRQATQVLKDFVTSVTKTEG